MEDSKNEIEQQPDLDLLLKATYIRGTATNLVRINSEPQIRKRQKKLTALASGMYRDKKSWDDEGFLRLLKEVIFHIQCNNLELKILPKLRKEYEIQPLLRHLLNTDPKHSTKTAVAIEDYFLFSMSRLFVGANPRQPKRVCWKAISSFFQVNPSHTLRSLGSILPPNSIRMRVKRYEDRCEQLRISKSIKYVRPKKFVKKNAK